LSNDVDNFVRAVATNIRRLRGQAHLTLAELASAAGLGKSTLAQLESGKGNPSVETLWAIAAALQVPFGQLVEEGGPRLRVVRVADQPEVRADASTQIGRLITASDRRGTFELYAMDIGDRTRHAEPHHAGVVEHLLCVTGAMRVGPAGETVELQPGDLVTFPADVPHEYTGLPAAHYVLLMSYP
jgi:transcriptional regulator with XRE-family HTH domain